MKTIFTCSYSQQINALTSRISQFSMISLEKSSKEYCKALKEVFVPNTVKLLFKYEISKTAKRALLGNKLKYLF